MAELPSFRFITVRRAGPHAVVVRWAINPHDWPAQDLSFVVFRSNSPSGPWDDIGAAETGAFTFHDFGVFSTTVRSYYYLVRAVSMAGRGFRDSRAFVVGMEMDAIAVGLIRKKLLSMTVRNGVQVAVLVAKTWGPNCNRCYNHQRMAPTEANCPECFGTGYVGGYLAPFYTPAILNPIKRAIVAAGVEFDVASTYLELAHLPTVDVGDVIVDTQNNVRYRVQNVTPFTHRTTIISQVVAVLRVDENDVVYTLPVTESNNSLMGRGWDLVERDKPSALLRDVTP